MPSASGASLVSVYFNMGLCPPTAAYDRWYFCPWHSHCIAPALVHPAVIGKITYAFSATIWQYQAGGGWYFVSMPQPLTSEIRTQLQWMEEGWGRLKVSAHIGHTHWETAIWFDTKLHTYILPLKAAVRKEQHLSLGQDVLVKVMI